jgi:hypothetical protein
MNFIEATLGVDNTKVILELCIEAAFQSFKTPHLRDEIEAQLDDAVISVIKDSLSSKMNPEELVIALERQNVKQLLDLLPELYGREITERINARINSKHS